MTQNINMRGIIQITAYPRGLLQRIMNAGYDYDEARRLASDWAVVGPRESNIIVTSGYTLMAHVLTGEEVTYCAIGTDSTAPAVGNTTLGTEVKRLQITSWTQNPSGGAPAQVRASTFFPAAQCTYDIEEEGLFGYDATSTTDSGTMLNHGSIAYDNSSGADDLTVEITLEFGAAA